ncbi:head completion/stabilization protein [Photobacterium angustum]|uniref:Head protein n=1 Tax=Photobacterium angustum TaxID=661 RepID=A0A855SF88_PHOAN|nr:head completion/stabilization protein [Photobacterium angustum]KJF83567.1 head protein [Photobacterium damselae subsp. damselae]KJG42568.1 head protein [Photobacterium angustum]KJG47875.1 head protein [Photobacterium angustum]KJG49867.1 head protein [Photobacterium angustum]KJG54040.1 head protein [Photobacterium angustum]
MSSYGFGGGINENQTTTINGNGWPDLTTEEFRQLRRISFTFDEQALAMAIGIAADAVQEQLNSIVVDDKPPMLKEAKALLYKRAVYGRAHADLLPEFATQDRRKEANNLATDEPKQADNFLAQSVRDVRQLLGLGRASARSI